MRNSPEEIINSLEGIQRAKAPKGSFLKIQEKLSKQQEHTPSTTINSMSLLRIAAVITLMICTNIWVVIRQSQDEQVVGEIDENYSSITMDFNIYDYE